jgi:cell division septum initiation protein DivIVA
MQELSQKNDDLQKQNNDLQDRVAKLETIVNQLTSGNSIQSNANQNATSTSTSALLMQNTPNPFNQSSFIRFSLPSSVTNAAIIITDMSGKTIKQFNNLSSGNGTVTVEANSLSPGTYLYTLIVNGKKVDSKQMVLVK